MKQDLVAGVDLGTTKVCALIGQVGPEDEVEILGVGLAPSHGLRKGIVVDISKSAESIIEAVEKAEKMSGFSINSVYVGVTGGHISSRVNHSIVSISPPRYEITEQDRGRAISICSKVDLPDDQEVIHTVPRAYVVDGQRGILNPVGMSATRLEVETNIITGSVTSLKNVIKSFTTAGIEVTDLVLECLASSYAVLTESEKSGAILLDMGGGTTDVAIFRNYALLDTFCLPVGGNHITNDISIGLRIPLEEAERVKIEHGRVDKEDIDPADFFEIKDNWGESKAVLTSFLAGIIEIRVREILNLIKREIEREGPLDFLPRVVVTGGSSLLRGVVELSGEVFDMPSRIGVPLRVSGLVDRVTQPIYATGVGLLTYGRNHQLEVESRRREEPLLSFLVNRVRNWFSGLRMSSERGGPNW
ncbi:cell division protein FtsA [Candidatus Hakubella thermalkaliphila]|uniref:Cell division protein FtsA n=1 Tax=Candidatus Hakubella thermalkaliphila TaxID=2754717 RepID=A0A6V8PPE1_9ACTN|nr:cell division protein FtsA [Candidatus Hakubella thermalkaliphila]GFP20812.1 cell division protein FtsA [Candidatus Hakubella thermalkaliphila]GFP34532.1 cell division protein FtsA [Candidatus Hakubella thermalkaliphila]